MKSLPGSLRLIVAATLMLTLSACATEFRNHGYAPTDAELGNVIVGRDDRDAVATTIGRPTASGLLEDGAWYYVESRFRHFAYQAPREIERQVVVVSFNGAGRVANIERFGLEDGRVIALSRRVTETSTTRQPILRQLFGNLGQPSADGLFN